ncbi:MAG: hypothetical protein AAGC96_08775, partial [Pseudomonadota bacterium]
PGDAMISRDPRLDSDYCPSVSLMLLTADEDALTDHIETLPASGWTAGHIGLQWAYYTISYDWANYMPAGSKPGDHTNEDTHISKYIILMTDGQFNTAYADVQKYGSSWKAGKQKTNSQNFTDDLCAVIKNDDIKIFTIGFQLTNSSAISMLKDCATPDVGELTFHYEPDTAAELEDTYKQIAQTIQSLVLIQ